MQGAGLRDHDSGVQGTGVHGPRVQGAGHGDYMFRVQGAWVLGCRARELHV